MLYNCATAMVVAVFHMRCHIQTLKLCRQFSSNFCLRSVHVGFIKLRFSTQERIQNRMPSIVLKLFTFYGTFKEKSGVQNQKSGSAPHRIWGAEKWGANICALSQGPTSRPLLCFDPNFMKDAQCAEQNEKNI